MARNKKGETSTNLTDSSGFFEGQSLKPKSQLDSYKMRKKTVEEGSIDAQFIKDDYSLT